MSCLLEVDEPTVCGDIVQFLYFGFAHASVFTQIFVKGHIGSMYLLMTMSVRVTIIGRIVPNLF